MKYDKGKVKNLKKWKYSNKIPVPQNLVQQLRTWTVISHLLVHHQVKQKGIFIYFTSCLFVSQAHF